MPGIDSVSFISATDSWDNFKDEYLTEELAAGFTENPLKDSSSYKVKVSLDADTKAVRQSILELEGVRKVTDISKARNEERAEREERKERKK